MTTTYHLTSFKTLKQYTLVINTGKINQPWQLLDSNGEEIDFVTNVDLKLDKKNDVYKAVFKCEDDSTFELSILSAGKCNNISRPKMIWILAFSMVV